MGRGRRRGMIKIMSSKKIKILVQQGAAIDIEKITVKPLKKELVHIGTSTDSCGVNGALFKDMSGQQYAIIGRTSLLLSYI